MFTFKNKQYASASEALDEYIRNFELNQSKFDQIPSKIPREHFNLRPKTQHKPLNDDSLLANDTQDELNTQVEKLENMINYLSIRIGQHKNETNLLDISKTSNFNIDKFDTKDPIMESLSMFENLNKELMKNVDSNKNQKFNRKYSNDIDTSITKSVSFSDERKLINSGDFKLFDRASSTPTSRSPTNSLDNLLKDIKTVLY